MYVLIDDVWIRQIYNWSFWEKLWLNCGLWVKFVNFINKHPDNEYLVTFTCPEFTSLCPKTGQPDFAKILISYIPRERMVESKSLKLYLFSFRNHGDFHEDCVNIIMKDLIALMDPKYIEVTGLFTPRGGIAIYPFANYGDAEHQDLVKSRLLASFRNDF